MTFRQWKRWLFVRKQGAMGSGIPNSNSSSEELGASETHSICSSICMQCPNTHPHPKAPCPRWPCNAWWFALITAERGLLWKRQRINQVLVTAVLILQEHACSFASTKIGAHLPSPLHPWSDMSIETALPKQQQSFEVTKTLKIVVECISGDLSELCKFVCCLAVFVILYFLTDLCWL